MELPSQFTEISFNSNIKNTATIRNIKMTEIEVNYSFAISSMWFSAKLKHLNKYKVIFFLGEKGFTKRSRKQSYRKLNV